MDNYSIKKISNGEFKEISKKFTLNVDRYCSNKATLYFDVEGEENPFCMDVNMFFSIMVDQIQKGLMESFTYKDGLITVSTRDGNTIKNYTYDFNWGKFTNNLRHSALEELKVLVYKIASIYKNNPNSAYTSTQKYLRLIMDIMDGDRLPKIEDKEELLRIFEVYNSSKKTILVVMLQNAVFYDDNGKVLDYGKHLRARRLNAIKYDVLQQMELKMIMFAVSNDALEMYQEYVGNTYVPRIEIQYKYVDQDGNEVAPPVEGVEAGTLLSAGKEVLKNTAKSLKKTISKGLDNLSDKLHDRRRAK